MKYLMRALLFIPYMILLSIGLIVAFLTDDDDLIESIDDVLDYILALCEFKK